MYKNSYVKKKRWYVEAVDKKFAEKNMLVIQK